MSSFHPKDTPIQDHLLASNVTTSKITLIGGTLNMKVNDVIQVKIMMHDGYGKPKDRGGDLVIIRTPLFKASLA